MTNPEALFSNEEKQLIADAVGAAESRTSGEIVPYVVGRSDEYPEALWRAGTLVCFLVLFVCGLLDVGTTLWLGFGIVETAFFAIAGFGAGMALAKVFPALRMLFVSHRTAQQRVHERATLAFLTEEVFKTRERTGILLFLSLLERRVQVLGDSGINAKVDQSEWDGIVAMLIDGMKRSKPAEGMIRAIESCGKLLETHGVAIRSDDTDELSNTVRFSAQ